MFKKIVSLTFLLFVALSTWAEGRAKYVFYFIGDGMGVNQVLGTETYLAALEGRIGVNHLCFTSFPHVALASTYSATNGVTDSAASGTALSTGRKTKNGAVGMLQDQKTAVNGVAVWAHEAGAAVGISTSVSIDHATPACFYAHQPERHMYYEIGCDLTQSDFDFFAGSDFISPQNKKDDKAKNLYDLCKETGYTIVRGYDECVQKGMKADKLILFQSEKASQRDRKSLPYAIDSQKDDLTLTQITQAGIEYLSQKQKDGFFFMIEGGKIDFACHSNDAGTAFREVIDMDNAVKEAYKFYQQHPDETLIVITADHETGGLVLGRGPYELHTDLLRYQQMSAELYSRHIQKLHKEMGKKFTWEVAQKDIATYWGLGKDIELTKQQVEQLHQAYKDMMKKAAKDVKSLYARINLLANAARDVMAQCTLIGWQSGGHSNGHVPVWAVGVGAEEFHGRMENSDIPLVIAKVAGWTER